ncbi:transposase [Streptomyces sp. NPDC101165]|uniref:transposase n=1 Tax=Streptomyces sp. NPDC101165 TaxID=3366119 RepID=UPI00381DE008
MPADFPAWGRVYAFFRRWREHGLIAEFHDRLRGKVREREGHEAQPTAGIIDAQSVRAAATVPAASRGYDGGKKVPGRKRHIVTDCLGLLLVVAVTAANFGDRDAAVGLLTRLRRLHRDITLVWADGGYTSAPDVLMWDPASLAEPHRARNDTWRIGMPSVQRAAVVFDGGPARRAIGAWDRRVPGCPVRAGN